MKKGQKQCQKVIKNAMKLIVDNSIDLPRDALLERISKLHDILMDSSSEHSVWYYQELEQKIKEFI